MKPLALVGLLLLAAPAVPASDLTIYTTDYPPLSIVTDGKQDSGIGYELLQHAARLSGVNLDIRSELPWKRAQQAVQKTANTCVYPLTRAPEREALFRWVGLLHRGQLGLFALNDSPAPRSLAAATRLRIVVMLGTSAENRLKEHQLPYSTTRAPAESLLMLQEHSVDLWAVHDIVARYYAAQQHMNIKQVLPLGSADSWLGCHRATTPLLANKLAAALAQLQQNGEAQRIARRYLP